MGLKPQLSRIRFGWPAVELVAVLPPLTSAGGGAQRWQSAAGQRACRTRDRRDCPTGSSNGRETLRNGSPWGWGVYAAFSWTQNLRVRDPADVCNDLSIADHAVALRWVSRASPFVTYGVGFWGPPFMLRAHAVDLSDAATILGLSAALGGLIGVAGGGWLADVRCAGDTSTGACT